MHRWFIFCANQHSFAWIYYVITAACNKHCWLIRFCIIHWSQTKTKVTKRRVCKKAQKVPSSFSSKQTSCVFSLLVWAGREGVILTKTYNCGNAFYFFQHAPTKEPLSSFCLKPCRQHWMRAGQRTCTLYFLLRSFSPLAKRNEIFNQKHVN